MSSSTQAVRESIMLGRAASHLVIDKALQCNARVAFTQSPSAEIEQWHATVEFADANRITARLTGPCDLVKAGRENHCWVILEVDRKLYGFEASMKAPTGAGAGTATIDRPEKVELIERRKSKRCRFARTTYVELIPDAGHTPARGTMLNAHGDGMACLVERGSWTASVESSVHLRFCLSTDDVAFCLPARVTSLTPAGDANTVIVGFAIEYEAKHVHERDRLASALARLS